MKLIEVTERYQCSDCGTLIRPGQPHTALKPRPHQSFAALIVHETLEQTDSRDGSHGEIYEAEVSTPGRTL